MNRRRIGLRTLLSPGPAPLGSVFSFVLAPLFLLHSKQELFHYKSTLIRNLPRSIQNRAWQGFGFMPS